MLSEMFQNTQENTSAIVNWAMNCTIYNGTSLNMASAMSQGLNLIQVPQLLYDCNVGMYIVIMICKFSQPSNVLGFGHAILGKLRIMLPLHNLLINTVLLLGGPAPTTV